MRIVGIEGGPAAVPALHPDDPFGGPIERVAIAFGIEAVERQPCRGAVVEVRIMRVLVLKGPAAGS